MKNFLFAILMIILLPILTMAHENHKQIFNYDADDNNNKNIEVDSEKNNEAEAKTKKSVGINTNKKVGNFL
tara:strand:+ start:71 stop:283 length:213 start_codon:yes stop_codon:yes gene_type:complete